MAKNRKDSLREKLNSSKAIESYLADAFNISIDKKFGGYYLVAIRNVIDATVGISGLSKMTGLGRESLYKSMSIDGNPSASTLMSVLSAIKELSFKLSLGKLI